MIMKEGSRSKNVQQYTNGFIRRIWTGDEKSNKDMYTVTHPQPQLKNGKKNRRTGVRHSELIIMLKT